MVVGVAVAGTGWGVGVLDRSEQVHCSGGFLWKRSVVAQKLVVRDDDWLTVGATLRDAMIAVYVVVN